MDYVFSEEYVKELFFYYLITTSVKCSKDFSNYEIDEEFIINCTLSALMGDFLWYLYNIVDKDYILKVRENCSKVFRKYRKK